MNQKPGIPKGTRDFLPQTMVRRNYIFDIIREVFQNYGYLPIETPAMENLNTLMGKYGEEGDRLLFKLLNSGDFLKDLKQEDVDEKRIGKVTTSISEKGLRYDLTVPFARFVVQHRNELNFPFKRYQIQPVWRADRPQKGRYREFTQCDVDVIGSDSLLNEVELVRMIDDVFSKLKINAVIKLNNRKILSGISQFIDAPEMLTDITTAMDKLDKIGIANVVEELKNRGIYSEMIDKILPIIELKGDNYAKLDKLDKIIGHTRDGSLGVEEIRTVLDRLSELSIHAQIEFDQALARGLNYYTGSIIEVKASDVEIGSICGGGRYDNLTGVFGLAGTSGVGVSFGADRIYDVMNELDLFSGQLPSSTQLLLVNFGEKEARYSLKILEELQKKGIRAELYPDTAKMKKQMKYADQKGILYVLLIGEEEMNSGELTLKNMQTGEQIKAQLSKIIKLLKD
jgi:histidyl-tRNA synthetase